MRLGQAERGVRHHVRAVRRHPQGGAAPRSAVPLHEPDRLGGRSAGRDAGGQHRRRGVRRTGSGLVLRAERWPHRAVRRTHGDRAATLRVARLVRGQRADHRHGPALPQPRRVGDGHRRGDPSDAYGPHPCRTDACLAQRGHDHRVVPGVVHG